MIALFPVDWMARSGLGWKTCESVQEGIKRSVHTQAVALFVLRPLANSVYRSPRNFYYYSDDDDAELIKTSSWLRGGGCGVIITAQKERQTLPYHRLQQMAFLCPLERVFGPSHR